MRSLVVVALGGNALLERGRPPTLANQRAAAAGAATALADVARDHRLVVTHGNGPQVGLLAMQQADQDDPLPLDVLGAETEGAIGYLLEQELDGRLLDTAFVTLLTRTLVDADDPAFETPVKPIGAMLDRGRADALAHRHGWTIAADGDHWRRVVASPEPRAILQAGVVGTLVDHDVVVICAGGGGIPVVEDDAGRRHGVEAVVDKDLTSSMLAIELGAATLLLLTDVEHVVTGWRTPDARPLRRARVDQLREQDFAAGSMGPKVDAACRFVEATGGRAVIGRLDQAVACLAGEAGTEVVGDALDATG